jgi:hypothetical protein
MHALSQKKPASILLPPTTLHYTTLRALQYSALQDRGATKVLLDARRLPPVVAVGEVRDVAGRILLVRRDSDLLVLGRRDRLAVGRAGGGPAGLEDVALLAAADLLGRLQLRLEEGAGL